MVKHVKYIMKNDAYTSGYAYKFLGLYLQNLSILAPSF